MGATRVGKTLGNFRILECLGSGGAGMIWKAEDLSLGRVVALKALRPELAQDGEMSERFRAEARTLAKLSHPNVASLYSLIEDDDGLFLVMEYVEGNTLAALLATSGPLPFDSAFALFHQVLDGVGHAHEAGVVHRDLKPANLMVDARGRVKVMDFGIARIAGAARTTHHGKLVGTPEYMSPEQVRGEDATLRSDIYSLGIVLYEMLTGQPPFRAAASFELMRAQLESDPPDPLLHRRDLDPSVASAILRALAKSPPDRFASTRELQNLLLAAGASWRGRTVLPVWSDVPTPGASSEALTLASASALTVSIAGRAEHARATEPYAAVHAPAPNALDEKLDEAFARASSEETARADAPATRVIDASLDTALIEPARPTRMLEDAPFAANAQALGRDLAGETRPARRAQLLWAAGAALALLLALGVVKLVSSAEPAAPPAPLAAEAPASVAASEPEEKPLPARVASEAAAEPTPSEAVRPKPVQRARKPAPAVLPAPEPAPSEEESGWTIRR
jgi:serine/threonine-protein kinase